MRHALSFASIALSLSLVACAAEPADENEPHQLQSDLTQQTASMTFHADFTHDITGVLAAGVATTVTYDPSRLSKCRGMKYGQPAWSIAAHYQVDGGPVMSHPVVVPNPSSPLPSLTFAQGGHVEMWFVNSDVWGCVAYDSVFGNNYHFDVQSGQGVAWAGLERSVVSRCTDGQGEPCGTDWVALSQGFMFDTWARQRAIIANLYFEVWEPGVTDWNNPDLWKQLDVQVHYRFDPNAPFESAYVDLDRRVGNNARYAVSLRELDPFGGNTIVDPADCPTFPYSLTANGSYVETTVELFFTVNGIELRPAPNDVFTGTFQDYAGLYAVCP